MYIDEPEARGEVNNEKLMVCFRKGGREVKMFKNGNDFVNSILI